MPFARKVWDQSAIPYDPLMACPAPMHSEEPAFTLLETLVSLSIFLMIMVSLVSVANLASRIKTRMEGNLGTFQEAAEAFDDLTRHLRSATLNTYISYYPDPTLVGSDGQGMVEGVTGYLAPRVYVRKSELHFVVCAASKNATGDASLHPTGAVFFQEPIGYTTDTVNGYFGLSSPLCSTGYFIEYSDNSDFLPSFRGKKLQGTKRFRLMRFLDTTENMAVYSSPYGALDSWISAPLQLTGNSRPVRPVAENIVALILTPKLAPGDTASGTGDRGFPSDYTYNSKILVNSGTDLGISVTSTPVQPTQQHQLPPIVNVTMVAIDEISAKRLAAQAGSAAPDLGLSDLFQSVDKFDDDLVTLKATLQQKHLNYHVFQTDVALREAKWNN
jgi:uncharacterized protein (TIGR02599 family)